MSEKGAVVDAFAALLAGIKDDAERARVLSNVRLRAMKQAPEEAFEPDVTRLREYLATPIEVPPSLVWPTIAVRGEITTTLGRAGKGKTTMNLNRIFAWAAGKPLFPGWADKEGNEYLKPERPLRTLIAENEGNAGMFHQKVGILLNKGPLKPEDRELCLDNLFIHGDGGYSGMKLDTDKGVNELRAAVEKTEPDIVFIEPFRSLWSGEENSSTDMAVVVDNLVAMATDYDCAVILSHHERKGGTGEDGEKMSRGRGSTVLEGVVAVMENFESIKAGEFREMTWSKARYLPAPHPVRMEWDTDTGWYRWVSTSQVEDTLLSALRRNDEEPMTTAELAEETDESQRVILKHMNAMRDANPPKVKRLPSVNTGSGSSGYRWMLKSHEEEGSGGLAL